MDVERHDGATRHETRRTRSPRRLRTLVASGALALVALACAMQGIESPRLRLWNSGFGPVLPHETFPADCSLCHEGQGWQDLRDDFTFDHAAETGVPLHGAHERATCIRCHNDRGPVSTFQSRGCGGCHEDIHKGSLGTVCTTCHQEQTWQPQGQVELHRRTRFPLLGVHAVTSCYRCHPGAEVGHFRPVDTECVTCHQSDLARATNPNHAGLGWVDNCNRCHLPRTWNHAEIND
jgi:hypothetical protein